MEDYFAAKAQLFDGRARRGRSCVDDDVGRPARRAHPSTRHRARTTAAAPTGARPTSSTDADGEPAIHRARPGRRRIAGRGWRCPGGSTSPTRCSRSPAWRGRGRRRGRAAERLAGVAVPGRMERVDAGQAFLGVVDYAHKPDARRRAARRAARPGHHGPADHRARLRRRPGPRQAPADGRGRRAGRRRADRHRRQPAHRGPGRDPGRDARRRASRSRGRGEVARDRRPARGDRRGGRRGPRRRRGRGRWARATRPARRSAGVRAPVPTPTSWSAARSRPPGEAPRDRSHVIPLALAEIAAVTGGRLHRRRPGDRAWSPVGRVRLPRGRPGRAVRRVARRAGRRARLRRGRRRAGAVGVLAAPRGRRARGRSCRRRGPHGTYLGDADPDGSGAAVLAALARLAAHVVDRLPGLTVVGITGSSGKTSTKDLIAALLAPARPDRRPARLVQQRARPPVHGAAGRRRHPSWCWRWAPAASATSPHLCRVAPPRIGVVLNVGTRAPRRVRLGRGDRRGQGRAGRGAAAPTGVAVLNADDPLVAAMAARTAGPGRPGRRAADGRRPGRGRRARRAGRARVHAWSRRRATRRSTLRLVGAPPGRQRAGRRGGRRSSSAARPRAGRRGAVGGGARVSRGGWRSPTGPTASPSSTTRTTPTRPRCAAALHALAAIGRRPRAPGRCSATWPSSGDDAVREHDEVGRLAARLASTGWSWSVDAARRRSHEARTWTDWGGESRAVAESTRRSRCCAASCAPGDVVLVKGSRAGPGAATRDRADRPLLERRSRAVRGILVAAGVALVDLDPAAPRPDQGLHPAGLRPADPRRRPAEPPGQARHADHGRRRDHRRDVGRLPRRRTLVTRRAAIRPRRRCWCCS